MGTKDRDLNLQEEISYIYTFKLDYSKNSILYQKKKKDYNGKLIFRLR